MSKPIRYIAAFAILLLVMLPEVSEAQCAMCKAVVEGGRDNDGYQVGSSINNGILYLMGIPYILLFILFHNKIVGFFREYRQLWN